MNDLSNNSIVKVNLSVQKDGDEYTIGDLNTNVFIRVPLEAILVINELNGDKSIEDIQKYLLEQNGLEVDVLDFVSSLLELQLVYSIDGDIIGNDLNSDINLPNKIAVKMGKILFSKFFLYLYAFITAITISLLIFYPRFIPSYRDIFIIDNVGLNMLMFFIISWIINFTHESAHYLASIRDEIPVKFKLSLRLYWLVIEADMTGLWSISKNKRYVAYLAGMAWDFVILFFAIMIQMFYTEFQYLSKFASMISLILIFRSVWQFLVFLRTDIYYVIINMINSTNIHGNSKLYLSKIFSKYDENKENEWNELSSSEKFYSKYFCFAYIIGATLALALLVFYSLPGTFLTVKLALTQIFDNSINTYKFFDGLLTIFVILLNVTLWCVGAVNKIRTFKSPNSNDNNALAA